MSLVNVLKMRYPSRIPRLRWFVVLALLNFVFLSFYSFAPDGVRLDYSPDIETSGVDYGAGNRTLGVSTSED
jgi:hypothetical protein